MVITSLDQKTQLFSITVTLSVFNTTHLVLCSVINIHHVICVHFFLSAVQRAVFQPEAAHHGDWIIADNAEINLRCWSTHLLSFSASIFTAPVCLSHLYSWGFYIMSCYGVLGDLSSRAATPRALTGLLTSHFTRWVSVCVCVCNLRNFPSSLNIITEAQAIFKPTLILSLFLNLTPLLATSVRNLV